MLTPAGTKTKRREKVSPWNLYRGKKIIFILYIFLFDSPSVLIHGNWKNKTTFAGSSDSNACFQFHILHVQSSALCVLIVLSYSFICMLFQYPFIPYLEDEHWGDVLCMLLDMCCTAIKLLKANFYSMGYKFGLTMP